MGVIEDILSLFSPKTEAYSPAMKGAMKASGAMVKSKGVDLKPLMEQQHPPGEPPKQSLWEYILAQVPAKYTPKYTPPGVTPTATPYQVQTAPIRTQYAPTPTPSPYSQRQPLRIAIPSANGEGETIVPEPAASAIYNAFDKYGEATNAAQVLHHPMQISGTPNEVQQGFNHWGNRGENPDFRSDAVNINRGGSKDTGLFQINSDTFNGMMSNPYWKSAMERRGITSYDQMNDPYKNALMGMLILMRGNFDPTQGTMNKNPNYSQWYGAPQQLRVR